MVSEAAFNALAYGVPKREEAHSPAKSEVARLANSKFPNPESLSPAEIAALAVSGIIYLALLLFLDLNAVYTCVLIAAGAAAMAFAYRYFLINGRQVALLSACMLLARMEKQFQMLADFINSSLLPVERLMDSGRSTTLTPLAGDKQRHYFMLVQIRSAMADRGRKIHECLDDPEMGKLKACFEWVGKEVSLHQSALAQSRTVVPLENIEEFTLALMNDLDPEGAGEEFLAQSQG